MLFHYTLYLLPAWILLERRVKTDLLKRKRVKIVSLAPQTVARNSGDWASVVDVVGVFRHESPLRRTCLGIIYRLAGILQRVHLVVRVAVVGAENLPTKFLTGQVDMCDTPALQVVETESLTVKLHLSLINITEPTRQEAIS